MLLALTGLRKTEAMTLKWTDIDLEDRTLQIRAENAKNGREHKLPISDCLLKMFQRRAADRKTSDYVFAGRNIEHLSTVQNSVAAIVRQIDCGFSLHDLRRGFVSAAAKVGIPHHLIKRLVNHAGDDMTAGYIILNADDLRAPMETANTHLLKLMQAQT